METKFSICNEVFGKQQSLDDWRAICEYCAACGYHAIEIAPFTFGPDVSEISPMKRREIKAIANGSGLEICSLHWLLVSPAGLHINARDESLRERTVEYLRALIRFGGDVGVRVMVFGSPAQRRVEDDYQSAWQRTLESYHQVLPTLEEHRVLLCQEALLAPECDFIQTAAEAHRMVQDVGHANFRLMLDVKSMSAEASPISEIIQRFGRGIEHFHVNDANRRAPGYGETDFRPISGALADCGYSHYVSLEPFDYRPDPKTLARESLAYLKDIFNSDV